MTCKCADALSKHHQYESVSLSSSHVIQSTSNLVVGTLRTWQTIVMFTIVLALGVLVAVDIAIGSSIVVKQNPTSFFTPSSTMVEDAHFDANQSIDSTISPVSTMVEDIRFDANQSIDSTVSPVEVPTPSTVVDDEPGCSPGVLDLNQIKYQSDHRFYTLMKSIAPLPPPVFKGNLTKLCDENMRLIHGYQYCLPISGRKDEPYCNAPDRMDLLVPLTPDTLCYGSALHMLLVDVYEEFKAAQASPFITYGTLLGAIRNGSTIPFTEDTDIGYIRMQEDQLKELKDRLWALGYHMFMHGIWRVCIAPTHPLASNLYDPDFGLVEPYSIPYVDLYEMHQDENGTEWILEQMRGGRKLPQDKVMPYKQVVLNGMQFDSVADPIDFLIHEYGENYMVPKDRNAVDRT